MATQQAVIANNSNQTQLITWNALGNADVGNGVDTSQYPDRTFVVQGTFGGATVVFEGSMDGGTTWFTLHDFLGNLMSYTSAAIALVAENPGLVRPHSSGGSGSSINCYVQAAQA